VGVVGSGLGAEISQGETRESSREFEAYLFAGSASWPCRAGAVGLVWGARALPYSRWRRLGAEEAGAMRGLRRCVGERAGARATGTGAARPCERHRRAAPGAGVTRIAAAIRVPGTDVPERGSGTVRTYDGSLPGTCPKAHRIINQ